MRRKFFFLSFMVIAVLSKAQLFTESFSTYTVGSNLTTNGWSQCASGTVPLTINGTNLTYPGYYSTNTNNSLYFNSTASNYGGYCKTWTGVNSGSIYMSFLFRDSVIAAAATSGDYFITFGSDWLNNAGRVLFKSSGGSFQFGTRKSTGADAYSTTTYTPNQTHLVVLKYTFNTGTTTDDVVGIYVDPTLPSTEPATFTVTAPATNDFTNSIGNVFLRLNMSTANVPNAHIDAIKVATSWSDLFGTACTPTTTNLNQAICQGASIVFNGNTITGAGTFRDTLQTTLGCDSFIVLNVSVRQSPTTTLNQAICQGASIVFNGNTITGAGTFRDTLQTSFGCDSFIVFNVSVRQSPTTTLNQAICQGASIVFNGNTITGAGTFRDTLQTSFGCDSFIVLNVSVRQSPTTTLNQAICQGASIVFNGNTITGAGTFRDTLQTSLGCDSFIVLTVAVTSLPNITVNSPSICSGQTATLTANNGTSYTWTGGLTGNPATTQTLNSNASFTVTGTVGNCSNTAVATVTVNSTPAQSFITQGHDTLYSSTVVANATYNWYLNGNTTPIATTNSSFYKFTTQGTYTVKVVSNDCSSPISTGYLTTSLGVRNSSSVKSFAIFPNPTDSRLVLDISLLKTANVQLKIFSTEGKEMLYKNFGTVKDLNETLNISEFAKGIYILKLQVDDEINYQKVVKQ
ncbi:MAG: T9SS type A sorting domain-containing protein [Saprospirales bacterium]|nr:T9SS type A sorting domain-containing protein [Saprospirales bacterium]